jgi:hypothetical protein
MEKARCSSLELDAFKYAAIAEDRHSQGLLHECWHMAFTALCFDPCSADAHRILCLVLTQVQIAQITDNATVCEVLHESLFVLRRHLAGRLAARPALATEDVRVRPFVRFLMEMAGPSFMIDRVDLTV